MDIEEKKLIEVLKKKDADSLVKELKCYCKKLELFCNEKKQIPKSPARLEVSQLLIEQVCKSSDVLFIEVALAILRFMSRDRDIVLQYMGKPLFVKYLCHIGNCSYEDIEVQAEKNVNKETEVNACRCLCNIIFLTKDSSGPKLYQNSKFIKSVTNLVVNHKTRSFEQNNIALRFLFLIAALSNEGRMKLVEEYDARKVVLDFLKDILTSDQESSVRSSRSLTADQSNICGEILKVMFYLNMDLRRKAIYNEQELEELDTLLDLCSVLLVCKSTDATMTETLHCHTGNAIYSIPPKCFHVEKLIGKAKPENNSKEASAGLNMEPVVSLLNILRNRVLNDFIACDVLHPLLALFSQLCRLSRDIRIYTKQEILPPRKEFKHRPEEGKELRNKLIKLFTHNNTDLKHGAADFIFVLCKEKVDRFVKYTGYGNAAGLLALRGLLAGGHGETIYSDTDSDSDTEEYKQASNEIDPVTGHIHPNVPNPMEGMTEEQKEYLAVQLANEFSKLSSDNSPIQPMCVGEDGNLVPFQQKVHETQLKEENSSSDDDL